MLMAGLGTDYQDYLGFDFFSYPFCPIEKYYFSGGGFSQYNSLSQGSENPYTVTSRSQKQNVHLQMKNIGSVPWTKTGGFVLASQNPPNNNIWGVSKIPLPKDSVNPREVADFNFDITSPSVAGQYNFQWQMQMASPSGPVWFGDYSSNIKITVEGPTLTCVDYDYSNQPATNTPPLPLVKGWTYDTISNPTFNPLVTTNPQDETYGDYCTMNGVRATSSSGTGSGLMERYCTNGRRSSRYYLYNGTAGYNRLQEVCPNGCSNGACVISNPIPTVQTITMANCVGGVCAWPAGTTQNVTWQYSGFSITSSSASTIISTVSFNLCNPAGTPCTVFTDNVGNSLNKIPSGLGSNGTATYSAKIGANILTNASVRPYIGTGTNQSRVKICPTNGTGQTVLNGVCALSSVFTITTTTPATTTTSTTSPTAVLRGNLLANILKALGDILGRVIN